MKAFCINCVCSLGGHHVCTPPSPWCACGEIQCHRPIQRAFLLPAGRICHHCFSCHHSPPAPHIPLHSLKESPSLLLSLLRFLLIFLHLLLSSFLCSYAYYSSSSNSLPSFPLSTLLLLQLIHSFSLSLDSSFENCSFCLCL